MPMKDYDVHKLLRRSSDRTRRYGNWRQIYLDCGGCCCAIQKDGNICGSLFQLQFHHVTPTKIVLVCSLCHDKLTDPYTCRPSYNNNGMLTDDINREMERCGGYDEWIANYMLDISTIGSMAIPGEWEVTI